MSVVLTDASTGRPLYRDLLADTGAGSATIDVDLLLAEHDCLTAGGQLFRPFRLGGAYVGAFQTYILRVQVPALGFDQNIAAVGINRVPAGFQGLAMFRFLNRFAYGNFGDPVQFGLEL